MESILAGLGARVGTAACHYDPAGLVDSDMWNVLDDAAREQLRRKARETFPARRIGSIDDIGHAAVFLMTNPYVTGAVIEVSGGETLVSGETPP